MLIFGAIFATAEQILHKAKALHLSIDTWAEKIVKKIKKRPLAQEFKTNPVRNLQTEYLGFFW